MQAQNQQTYEPPEGVLETAIYSHDLDHARKFYGGVIGLEEILHCQHKYAFFRCGSTVVLIFDPRETIKQPETGAKRAIPGHGTSGAGHICFRAPGKRLAQWKKRLIEHGINIEQEITWDNGAQSIYFRDPDGNSLEFAQPKIWGYPDDPELEELGPVGN